MSTVSDKQTDPRKITKPKTLKTRNQNLSFSKLLDFNNIKHKLKNITINKNRINLERLDTKPTHKKEMSVTEGMFSKFKKNELLKGNGKKFTESGSLLSEESIFSKKCNI